MGDLACQFPLVCFDQMCHYGTDLVCFEHRGGYSRQTCATNVRLTRHTSMKKQNHIKVLHERPWRGQTQTSCFIKTQAGMPKLTHRVYARFNFVCVVLQERRRRCICVLCCKRGGGVFVCCAAWELEVARAGERENLLEHCESHAEFWFWSPVWVTF